MASRWDNAANAAIVGLAVLLGITWVARGLRGPRAQPEIASVMGPPSYVKEWREVQSDGLRLGSDSARIQLVVFSDLECPYCAHFHREVIPALERHYREPIGLTVVHLPMKSHRFAIQSATALECVADSRKQRLFLDEVYAKQDSIGIKSWTAYAVDVGITDTVALLACIKRGPPTRIERGSRWAERLGVHATPTVLVNGWRYSGTPTDSILRPLIDSILVGQKKSPLVDQKESP